MKKLLLIALVLSFIISCSTEKKQAEKVIKQLPGYKETIVSFSLNDRGMVLLGPAHLTFDKTMGPNSQEDFSSSVDWVAIVKIEKEINPYLVLIWKGTIIHIQPLIL